MTPQQIWHTIDEKEVLEKIASSVHGLTNAEAKKRLRIHGPNDPVHQKPKSIWWVFLTQFQSPLVYLLIISAIITALLGRTVDTWVILIIVAINAVVGFLQETKAEKSLEALKRIVSLRTKIIRDNEEIEIPARELVPGDIVVLESGAKIPADLRLLRCDDLKVDESTLTGESVPVHKNLRRLAYKTPVADRKNMAYAGTIVANGRGLGVVIATAGNTQIGKIAKEVAGAQDEKTPLHKNLEELSRFILYTVAIVSVIIFILGFIRGIAAVDIFLTVVAAAISVIPEGLPAVITIILAVGVYRMAQKKAIIRKLQAVETLGSITAIASDKTGTLTYNQMTVEKIYLPLQDGIIVVGKGYSPEGTIGVPSLAESRRANSEIKKLLLIGALCNNSQLIQKKGIWQIQGDPTEGALVVAAAKAKIFREEVAEKYPRLDEIPFSSEHHYMATLHRFDKTNLTAVKGTLEKVLSLCSHYYFQGKKYRLTKKIGEQIKNQAREEAEGAHRVLALSYFETSKKTEKISIKDIDNLIYLGFTAMDDPIRKDAIDAVKKCRQSGIRPIMITGDHPETALAIAKELGMADDNSAVYSSQDLLKLSPKALVEKVSEISIFARITPELKLKIVQALQTKNQIVGVTGDGVNDAPVLKQANVGIAMGKGGTDVARESADMVLLDDNFSTILFAIEEGRTIFLNIRRVVSYLMSTAAGEILILISSLSFGLPIPLFPVQILWINLLTDTTNCIPLAMEPKHTDVAHYPPRNPKEGIINNIVKWRIFFVAITMMIGTLILFKLELDSGAPVERARTVAFVTMVLFQIFNILNTRSLKTSIFQIKVFSNPYVLWSFLVSFAMAIFSVQLPFFQHLLHTVPLSLIDWLKIILVCLSIFAVVEIDKGIRKVVRSKY